MNKYIRSPLAEKLNPEPRDPFNPSLMDYQKQVEDRKRWHQLEAMADDSTPRCGRCNGPLEKIADPDIGIELICKNPDCEIKN